MTLPALTASLLRWVNTLKFKVVAITVATSVLAALVSTEFALSNTQADLQRLLLENARDDSERMAAMLGSKLETLEVALRAVASDITPQQFADPPTLQRLLLERPALAALFDSVFAARADGSMLARAENGVTTHVLPGIADREYFRQAMTTGRTAVSKPLLGRVSRAPIVVIAAPVRSVDGQSIGVLAGSVALRSTRLFSNLAGTAGVGSPRVLVMDGDGVLLAHPDPARVLGRAADEPGLARAFAGWQAAGRPIETRSIAALSDDHVVALANIPKSDWLLVRLSPQAVAMAPLEAAGRNAWRAAAGVAMLAALAAGGLAWHLTRPISRLHVLAEQMLTDDAPLAADWPVAHGEVGAMARAFRQVVEQRQARQRETQALLLQLRAVIDHAEVGIALTREGRFELVSRQFAHVFRCDALQLIGQSTRTIHASDAAYETLSARARPAFMSHGAFDGELELMRHGGARFWAHMRGRAVAPGDRSQGTIWTVEDVTEMREQRERLTWASSHDSLTGLANRAAFEVLLEHASARAAELPFCALFIDLDRFKQVNDSGGHAAGDALLRDVAQVLAAQVRKSDTVARLGGDEFAVLLDHCPVAQAELIAEKLRSAVVAYQLVWEGRVHSVGASIGLVPVSAALATATEVLRAADTACYAAKRRGRNCVAVHGVNAAG